MPRLALPRWCALLVPLSLALCAALGQSWEILLAAPERGGMRCYDQPAPDEGAPAETTEERAEPEGGQEAPAQRRGAGQARPRLQNAGGFMDLRRGFGPLRGPDASPAPRPAPAPAAPPARASAAPDAGPSQSIAAKGGALDADYQFLNFNRDRIRVRFSIPAKDLAAYEAQYGFTDADLERLRSQCKALGQDAYKTATQKRLSQEQYNAMAADVQKDCEKRRLDFLVSRGFRLLPGNVTEVDMPQLVRRNTAPLKGVAGALQSVGDKLGYDSENVVGAATALVQTALRYQIPPALMDGRHTGGILPPLTAMARGWGDCDTKTGVLAAILGNWPQMRMVGVAVPHHYLMGIRRSPGKGDMFVEYGGVHYVLIEPAGPAWLPPGQVGRDTVGLLQGEFKIEPFFD